MSLSTHSKFYYGYPVTTTSLYIDFNEGGSELTAELEIDAYSLTDFADALSVALNDAGALTYTVTVNRSTRQITIAATGNFALLVSTGSHAASTAFGTAGFTGANLTGAATYTGNLAAGTVYTTQFILQSYVAPQDFQAMLYGTVNKSASGKVEVVTFGTETFVEFNITLATSRVQEAGGIVRNNATGLSDLQSFMQYITTKGPLEFMPNEDAPETFITVILESTSEDSKYGLGYKLRELYGRGLPGYYETGVLKFRVIE